jgi:hypothetical protein
MAASREMLEHWLGASRGLPPEVWSSGGSKVGPMIASRMSRNHGPTAACQEYLPGGTGRKSTRNKGMWDLTSLR